MDPGRIERFYTQTEAFADRRFYIRKLLHRDALYRQQGCYEHTKQLHTWSFYEYRMRINGECWNIIINDDMAHPPDWAYPGSSSSKLSHDFCHIDTEASDDVYTNFWFVEMGGRQIWPFYATESFQEMDLS